MWNDQVERILEKLANLHMFDLGFSVHELRLGFGLVLITCIYSNMSYKSYDNTFRLCSCDKPIFG